MKRLALILLIALLCSACLASTGGDPDDRPHGEQHSHGKRHPPASDNPPAGENSPPSSVPTVSGEPEQVTLPFGMNKSDKPLTSD